ncbi:hypothetical protein ACFSQJ_00455 [Croceitalea marina]|uniref:Uncharacterized protein n=1 Tax=Croceitalea marina TaxID=1775166 RepID=A0ABW5MSD4_9FLAO
MKRLFVLICLVFLGNCLFGQYQMDIKLTDGTIKSGIYKWGKYRLIDKNRKEEIKFSEITSFIQQGANGVSNEFHILFYPKRKKLKRSKKALGWKVHSGEKIDLFHALFGSQPVHEIIDTKFNLSHLEVFARRKGEKYVYSLRCRDGIGCQGIKKRLIKFFYDCPELLKLIEDDEMDIMNTPEIVKKYEELCPN